jgi:hypothetical protein
VAVPARRLSAVDTNGDGFEWQAGDDILAVVERCGFLGLTDGGPRVVTEVRCLDWEDEHARSPHGFGNGA